MPIAQALHEIVLRKLDMVKFRKIKNMRFCQHRGRNIERIANIRQIIKKMGISQFFGVFIDVLLFNMSVRNEFCPNSHFLPAFRFYYTQYYTRFPQKSKPFAGIFTQFTQFPPSTGIFRPKGEYSILSPLLFENSR